MRLVVRFSLMGGGWGLFKLHLETRILPFAIDDPCDHEVTGSAVLSTDDQQGLIG